MDHFSRCINFTLNQFSRWVYFTLDHFSRWVYFTLSDFRSFLLAIIFLISAIMSTCGGPPIFSACAFPCLFFMTNGFGPAMRDGGGAGGGGGGGPEGATETGELDASPFNWDSSVFIFSLIVFKAERDRLSISFKDSGPRSSAFSSSFIKNSRFCSAPCLS